MEFGTFEYCQAKVIDDSDVKSADRDEKGVSGLDFSYNEADLLFSALTALRVELSQKKAELRRVLNELDEARHELGILENGESGSFYVKRLQGRNIFLEHSQTAFVERIRVLGASVREKDAKIEELERSGLSQDVRIETLIAQFASVVAEKAGLERNQSVVADERIEELTEDLQLFKWACEELGLDFNFFFRWNGKQWRADLEKKIALNFLKGVVDARMSICETGEARKNVKDAEKTLVDVISNMF